MTNELGPELEEYFKLKAMVRQIENYVPRTYQTIGGMWTTDTYKRCGVTVQIMDEGYSGRLFTNVAELDVIETYRNNRTEIEFKSGGIEEVKSAIASLEGQANE